MPSISLSAKDLAKLSASAREEIYELFPEVGKGKHKSQDDDGFSQDDELYPISKRLAGKCLAKPIDPKSTQLLKLVAEHQGRVLWSVCAIRSGCNAGRI